MNIDLTSIIITVIAFLCFLVPIYYSEVHTKKITGKFQAFYRDQARQREISIDRYETWRDSYAIGIEDKSGTLFYLRKKGDKIESAMISLDDIKSSRAVKTDNRLSTPKGQLKITTSVYLSLSFNKPDKPDVKIEFYKGGSGDSIRDEILLAEKWSKIVKSELKPVLLRV